MFLRKDVVTSNSVDLLSTVLWFLAPVHVYIHFQAYWACLVVIETNEKPVQRHDASNIAWRSSKEERRRTQEVLLLRRRGPRKAPKCVRREYVLSVSLRFLGFCAWQNRNCQSEYCLSRRDFFCNRKPDMSFSEADRMELDSTYSSSRKWDFLPGSFREGRRFDWRSMAIYRFVMTWKKI